MKFIPPPLVLLACLGLIGLVHCSFPSFGFDFGNRFEIGTLVALIAVGAELWLVRRFRQAKTTFNPIEVSKSRALITSGIYAYSRNPMYVGQMLVLFGGGLMIGSYALIPMLLLLFAYLDRIQIPREEAALLKNFGTDYETYCTKVRRWV